MSELSSDERAKLAAQLIEQTPPGEVNDVINAIRSIIADDDALMVHAASALRAYNLVQLTVVEHPAKDEVLAHTSLLSDAAILRGTNGTGGERYVDAIGKRSFTFDHVNMAVGGYEAYDLPEEEEAFRAELAKSLATYTKKHYPTGQSAVNCSQYPLLPTDAPPPTASTQEASTGQAEPTPADQTAEDAAKPSGEVVKDVITDQVRAEPSEPAPTPQVGETAGKVDELDQLGGLDKVDEAVEEAKEAEATADTTEAQTDQMAGDVQPVPASQGESGTVAEEEPKVVEEGGSSILPKPAGESEPTVTSASKADRKQERISDPTYTLEVVGNRYKTDAFWTGRWRTCWTVDKASNKVSGRLLVDVHYYEQGNVQLTTNHEASFLYPSAVSGQSIASQIVTTISKIEAAYQMELQDVYGDLGDKVFRSLRRALPVTRQKVDWEKVGGYSLGSDISKSRA